MIDRVLELEPGVRGRAVRNVPATLSLLDSHFPRFPVLPGVLLLDSMATLASLVAGEDGWRLRSAHTVRFRHFVRPGDQVVLTASVTGTDGSIVELTVTAEVEATTVATVRKLVLACGAS